MESDTSIPTVGLRLIALKPPLLTPELGYTLVFAERADACIALFQAPGFFL